jgi:hypothetical protein
MRKRSGGKFVAAGKRTFEKRPVEGPVDPRSASVVFGPDRNTADIPERSEGYERGLNEGRSSGEVLRASVVVGQGRDRGRRPDGGGG